MTARNTNKTIDEEDCMTNQEKSAYARAGVDYEKIEPFKRRMIEMAKKTTKFPNRYGVCIVEEVLHSHGGCIEWDGREPFIIVQTQEGLGNKNWVSEWMYANAGTGRTYYEGIGIDAVLMAANDAAAQGTGKIFSYTDEVAAGDSEWFVDDKRASDLAKSFLTICDALGTAIPAGESPSLRYLVNAQPPVKSAPSLSGCALGLISPRSDLITGMKLTAGDSVIGVTASGVHSNGFSLIIEKAMELPDKFLTKLPNGNTLGDEVLIPTRSYVQLVGALLDAKVDVHAFLPGTGDGVAKLAFDDRPFTYHVHTWVDWPIYVEFFKELGVSIKDILKTFNCGIGYYIFLPKNEVERAIKIGKEIGYLMYEVGTVKKGERRTIFGPLGDLVLPPPGH